MGLTRDSSLTLHRFFAKARLMTMCVLVTAIDTTIATTKVPTAISSIPAGTVYVLYCNVAKIVFHSHMDSVGIDRPRTHFT